MESRCIGLGLVALVVWNVVLGVLDFAPPVRILVSFVAALTTVIVGTRWLVLTSRTAAEFDEHLAAVREQHRRRPTLIATLDKASLR